MDPYTLSPQERQRYESLFPSYAKTEEDGSQFVYGSEAVPLFMKSGVDPNNLRDIWNMVDRNPVDNRLDKLEFALAMHLIVCVSKKNLPLPQGGALPPSLQALKVASNAPGVPAHGVPAPGAPGQQQPNQTPMLPPRAEASMAPPAPSSVAGAGGPPPLGGAGSGMGGMSISDAFEGMNTMDNNISQPAPETSAAPTLPPYVPEVPAPTTPPAAPEQPTPQPQPTYVQQPLSPQRETIRPTPAAAPVVSTVASTPVETYQVSDSHIEELHKLKGVLQKLQAENVSLKAQLGNMTDEEKQVQQELGQTITEITSLTTDLGNQRQIVLDAKNRLIEAKAELKAQMESKGVLTDLISEAKETTEAIQDATEMIQSAGQAQSNVTQNAPPAMQEDLFDMGYSNPMGAAAPAVHNAPPMPPQETFANEHARDSMMGVPTGGASSLPQPPPQPAGDVLAPAPEQHQTFSLPTPSAEFDQQANPSTGAPAPPQAGGYPAQAPMPPQAQGYPAQAPVPPQQPGYPAQAPMPPQAQGYPTQAPAPQQQQQQAMPGHNRYPSDFDDGYMMGGSAQIIPLNGNPDNNDNISVAAHSMASTGGYGYDDKAFEAVEEMKKKAKKADGVARDAEAAYRKLKAEADELRTDADRAEANARSLAAACDDTQKKKKRFGGGKKEKKKKEEAEQAAKDSALIKKHFMDIQGRALEAETLASQTRAEADRLRDEAETAELSMAAEMSKKQKQPAPAPAAPQAAAPAGDYPGYGGMAPQGQMPQYGMPNGGAPHQMMPPNGGGYGQHPPQHQQQPQAYGAAPQMSLPDPSKSAPGVMGNGAGGYGMPAPASFGQMAPAPVAGGDPYASPF